jgi:hypothetical protein
MGKTMGDEKKSNSVIPKAEALRKAGLSPAMTVIVLLMSSPGFYQAFFNRTADDTQKKVEIAYEVLANEVKHLREADEAQREEMQRLRSAVLKLSLISTKNSDDARQLAVDAAEEVVASRGASSSHRSRSSKKSRGKPAAVAPAKKIEEPKEVKVLRESGSLDSAPAKAAKPLPKSLDGLMEQRVF